MSWPSIDPKIYQYGLWTGIGLGALVEYPNFSLAFNTLGRDLSSFWKLGRVLSKVKSAQRNNVTIPDLFAQTVRSFPDKSMVVQVESGETWTFQEMDEYSNQVANYLVNHGYSKGDVIALFMVNQPKFIGIMLGMAKVGITGALINTNLNAEPLEESIRVAKSKGCIFNAELGEGLCNLAKSAKFGPDFRYFVTDLSRHFNDFGEDMDLGLHKCSKTQLHPSLTQNLHWTDNLIYIYTSGTTGLPKPAYGDHSRYILGSSLGIHGIGIGSWDRIYCTLPLYHSSGQWMALGVTILSGATLLLRSKFSATQFWIDCVQYKATCAQYIGEMCRFLLGTPKCKEESEHELKFMFGVGLGRQIWPEFVKRFKIPRIVEMYGSTEGTVGVMNIRNKEGSIGFISQLFDIMPFGLIKVDEAGDPVRDSKTGLCIRCGPHEPGELVGKVRDDDRGGPDKFKAYVGKSEETTKKMLRNIWKRGDIGFRTGDIMVMDEHGWLFFKDRTGDTFRWRGENVSTAEVESIISKLIGHQEVAVYGVEIPGTEGKAGMAAIHDPHGTVELESLEKAMRKSLPKYAQPLFIRILKDLDLTGTYKLMKKGLKAEGFNVTQIKDAIYFRNSSKSSYKLLDKDSWLQLQAGALSSKL